MIRSFADRETEEFFFIRRSKRFGAIATVAARKLELIYNARYLIDLKQPPGNRLELLKGDHAGQHNLRINQQFRVCFRWINEAAEDVEIVDYY